MPGITKQTALAVRDFPSLQVNVVGRRRCCQNIVKQLMDHTLTSFHKKNFPLLDYNVLGCFIRERCLVRNGASRLT